MNETRPPHLAVPIAYSTILCIASYVMLIVQWRLGEYDPGKYILMISVLIVVIALAVFVTNFVFARRYPGSPKLRFYYPKLPTEYIRIHRQSTLVAAVAWTFIASTWEISDFLRFVLLVALTVYLTCFFAVTLSGQVRRNKDVGHGC